MKLNQKTNPKVKASTLSVLMSTKDSITCGVELNEEYANVSLNLEQDQARILGYPLNWGVYDQHTSYYDSDSPTYEEIVEEMGEDIEEMPVYVSKETEKEIFTQLKKSLSKQFEDEMFKDQLKDSEKQEALAKIDKAIRGL